MAAKTPKQTDTIAPDILQQIQEYEGRQSFLKTINQKYGVSDGSVTCRVYRKNPNNPQIKPAFAYKFDYAPEVEEVQEMLGGGSFVLYLKYFALDGAEYLETVTLNIEGPPRTPPAPGSNGNGQQQTATPAAVEDPEEKLLRKMKLYKEFMNPGAPTDNGNIGSVVSALVELVKAKNAPAEQSGGIVSLAEKIILKNLDKSSETDLDKLGKTMEFVEKFRGPAAGGASNEWLEVAKLGIPVVAQLLNRQQPAQLQAGMPPAMLPANTMPPASELQQLINNLDHNFKFIGDKLTSIEGRLTDLEKENLTDEEYNALYNADGSPKQSATNGAALQTQNNGSMNLKNLDAQKITETLKFYVSTVGAAEVYKYCIENKEVETLEEFNGYMIKAGLPEYKPDPTGDTTN